MQRERGSLVRMVILIVVLLAIPAAGNDRPVLEETSVLEDVVSAAREFAPSQWILLSALVLIAMAGTIDVVSGEIERRKVARVWRTESVQLWPRSESSSR